MTLIGYTVAKIEMAYSHNAAVIKGILHAETLALRIEIDKSSEN